MLEELNDVEALRLNKVLGLRLVPAEVTIKLLIIDHGKAVWTGCRIAYCHEAFLAGPHRGSPSKSIIHFEGEVGEVFPRRGTLVQERPRLIIGGKHLEGGMTVRPPTDGEVLKAAHVTGLVFIPRAQKKPGLGIYAISSGRTPEREVCSENGDGRRDRAAARRLRQFRPRALLFP
jgi:hypothetical protein